jgi:hypothetical protein
LARKSRPSRAVRPKYYSGLRNQAQAEFGGFPFMRISGLLGAVIALSVLTPIAPARADISSGDLMYTDLFKWQGQDGTPTWREILAMYDCTEELTFYLWNAPSPATPVIIPPTPAIDSAVEASSAGGGVGLPGGIADSAPIAPVGPIGTPGGGVPGAAAVPEPSTWALLLLGFAGLGYASYRAQRKTGRWAIA